MLSKIKLQCMELWADKTMSFWCIVNRISNGRSDKIYYILEPTPFGKLHLSSIPFWSMMIEVSEDDISKSSWDKYIPLWHPITRWRLCYLQSTYNSTDTSTRSRVRDYFELQNSLYDKSILERPEEFCENILLPFLQSIKW